MGTTPTHGRLPLLLIVSLIAVDTTAAHADETWLVAAEAPAALPVSSPQSSLFGPGGMPSFAVYRSLARWALVGGRIRAGVLSDGDPPEQMGVADPGTGGLGSVSASLRLRPLAARDDRRGTGLWLEVSAGAGVTGDMARPTVEAGIGWGFQIGSANVGPSVRYLYIHREDNPLDSRSASLALVGVELTLFDGRDAPPPLPIIVQKDPVPDPVPDPVRDPVPVDSDGDGIMDDVDDCPAEAEDADGWQDDDGCPDLDNDGDMIADVDDSCPNDAEVVNGIDDQDGCPDEGLIVLIKDRIVLDERVLFDPRRARVKSRAKPVLQAIVDLWKQHPEWDRMIIEGHADKRGSQEYNMSLSVLRAERVKAALVKLGMAADVLEPVGMGETKPVATSSTEKAYQKNRRVEFVIIKEHEEIKRIDPSGDGEPATAPMGDDE